MNESYIYYIYIKYVYIYDVYYIYCIYYIYIIYIYIYLSKNEQKKDIRTLEDAWDKIKN